MECIRWFRVILFFSNNNGDNENGLCSLYCSSFDESSELRFSQNWSLRARVNPGSSTSFVQPRDSCARCLVLCRQITESITERSPNYCVTSIAVFLFAHLPRIVTFLVLNEFLGSMVETFVELCCLNLLRIDFTFSVLGLIDKQLSLRLLQVAELGFNTCLHLTASGIYAVPYLTSSIRLLKSLISRLLKNGDWLYHCFWRERMLSTTLVNRILHLEPELLCLYIDLLL